MGNVPTRARIVAAYIVLLWWLGMITYITVTGVHLPEAIWAIGPAVLFYLLGIRIRQNGSGNGSPQT